MIKKLQKKFVLVTMLSVLAVLTIIISSINVLNYRKISKDVDVILEMLAENDGKFPMPNKDKPDKNKQPLGGNRDNHISPETPYETRFFTARIDTNKKVMWTNTGSVAAISSDVAVEYANQVADSNKTKGYINNYRYMVKELDGGSLIVFVDCTNRLATAKNFLKASIAISIAGVLAVFVLVIFLSGKVMKPIVESYEKQKRFITDSSHEIKTPLAVIRANTEVIEMLQGDNEWTQSITNQVERLSELTKNMTMLARMDEEGVALSKQEFDLTDALQDTLASMEVLIDSKNLALSKDIEENVIYNGSEREIRQLIGILIDNAVKYSSGEISVSLKTHKNKIKLLVCNTVANGQKGNLDCYFDRFYRADESRSKSIEGFGIGLSIAKSIVELHNGKISASSADGRLVTFSVVL